MTTNEHDLRTLTMDAIRALDDAALNVLVARARVPLRDFCGDLNAAWALLCAIGGRLAWHERGAVCAFELPVDTTIHLYRHENEYAATPARAVVHAWCAWWKEQANE